MQLNQITNCSTCNTLSCILNEIDCKIEQSISNNWKNKSFSVNLPFDDNNYKKLLWYKRIVSRRLSNCNYPCEKISTQDIISKIKILINKWVVQIVLIIVEIN